MKNNEKKSSPGWLIAAIAAGVADVILLVLLIAAFVQSTVQMRQLISRAEV